MEDIADATLRKAMEGDMTALEEIYRNYSGFVYRTSLSIVKNVEDADEVTQEVFIRVLKNLKNFKFGSSFRTYLYRVAVNSSINYIRKNGKKYFEESIKNFEEPNNNSTIDEHYERKELTERFLKIMNTLDKEMREPFYLREVEDMKYEEIAILLNENINTVKTRVRRAREKLLKEIKDEL
jgi:RNA polymerase sigma-70 factor (ECF subfamily)